MTAIPAFKDFDTPGVNIVDFEPEPPQPLFRELPPAGEYPVSRLGRTLSAATEAIHDITQAPIEICAQSVLAAATLPLRDMPMWSYRIAPSVRCRAFS